MVYTYDNVVAEAQKAGVLERFTQEDHTAAQKNPEYGMSLLGLLKDASSAKTTEQGLLATEAANQLRKSYGITSPSQGTPSAQRLVAPEQSGTLSGSNSTTYQAVLDDIVNQKSFTYDPEKDPVYAAYEQKYLREGSRARENVLAQAAAMTGGRPSSYAISAAQQAENNYAAALADIIPTLRQNALAEHQNEMSAKYDILTALQAQRDNEENRKHLAVQDALAKYKALGYATPDVAKILGIPEGTNEGSLPALLNGGTNILDGIKESVQNVGSAVKDKLVGLVDRWKDPQELDYSITNQHNENEGWIMVGGKKLTYAELDKYIRTSKVTEKVDVSTGAITYEPGPNWSQNRAESVLDKRYGIT